jgi:malonyl CoA-acyl carrier protein transacylase
VFPRPVFRDDDREALERTLTATEWAQPAIGIASAALLAVLRQVGLTADAFAGHSGEIRPRGRRLGPDS